MTASPLEQLRSVFGTLSHEPPATTQADREAQREARRQRSVILPTGLPEAPEVHPRTGMVVVPSMRIDGSEVDGPWNVPESVLWDLLRVVPIEFVEERCLDGSNGILWARYRNHERQLRSALLRFDGVNRGPAYETWGAEYALNSETKDLLRREQAAYEAAKACGMEDMVAPMAAREVNLVPLLSDAIRERLAKQLRISPMLVDETLGTAATIHALPLFADNFVEHWGTLGYDEPSRWERASDRLRHSIYRAIVLDFLLGTADRVLCSFLYNRTAEKVAMYDFGLTFPNPAFTAEKYLRLRKEGWGRKPPEAMEDPTDPVPAHGIDTLHLERLVQENREKECVDTFAQVGNGMTQQVGVLLGKSLGEYGVPPACVAGFFARVAFLQADPVSVLKRPVDFVRNVLVPLRRGYGFGEGRNRHVVDYVSSTMTAVLGRNFDFAKSLQVKVPAETTLVV